MIQVYCDLYIQLKRKGELLSDADLLMGASAKAYNLELVTMDTDFKKLEKYGVKVKLIKNQ
ncbi:MAG: PIN domain-containing protein [Candidatus Njordarchaeales archaeon]